MKTLCIKMIGFYRKYISPMKKPCCRFLPTCSEYSRQAFAKYGFFKGGFLSIWRVLRCNPFCKGGYDPLK